MFVTHRTGLVTDPHGHRKILTRKMILEIVWVAYDLRGPEFILNPYKCTGLVRCQCDMSTCLQPVKHSSTRRETFSYDILAAAMRFC